MTTFKALVSERVEGADNKLSLQERNIDDLPAGEVLIRVHYSSLNFKDALSAKGKPGVTREYPHTPGIDAAGIIESSESDAFSPGDEVIVTGYDLGMNTSGGFAEYIRVPATWVVAKPEGLSLLESMQLGTAGLTAAICVDSLLQVGIAPEQGPVLVTGASGGVGSISVAILSKLGFEVVAGTGKATQEEFFKSIGAASIIDREKLSAGTERPMLKEQWAGVVDTVGGDILFNAVKSTKYGGSVACCGLVASPNFNANVFPFILRGVNLLGVDSVELPLDVKDYMWRCLATEWKLDNWEILAKEVSFSELPGKIDQIFQGQAVGRYVVNLQQD